ncbi:MAG: ATP-binding protein [Gemmataceae bacterium]
MSSEPFRQSDFPDQERSESAPKESTDIRQAEEECPPTDELSQSKRIKGKPTHPDTPLSESPSSTCSETTVSLTDTPTPMSPIQGGTSWRSQENDPPEGRPIQDKHSPEAQRTAQKSSYLRHWWQILPLGLSFCLVCVSHPVLWHSQGTTLWFPPIGIGFALVAWCGNRTIAVILLGVFTARLLAGFVHGTNPFEDPIPLWLDLSVLGVELFGGWWVYRRFGGSALRVREPRSATFFLLIIPISTVAFGSALQTAVINPSDFFDSFAYQWLGKAVGIMALTPTLLVFGTPMLLHYRWLCGNASADLAPTDVSSFGGPAEATSPPKPTSTRYPDDPLGLTTTIHTAKLVDWLETIGLAIFTSIITCVLSWEPSLTQGSGWRYWVVMLLLIVWASVRQGLRGAVTASLTTAVVSWFVVGQVNPDALWVRSFQTNLLALCSTGLLIGASSGWLRASEQRYRTFVSRIPVMLYSARIHQPGQFVRLRGNRQIPNVQIVLVSSAANSIFGCPPDALLGAYSNWLERVHPEDRELLIAAWTQITQAVQPQRSDRTPAPSGGRTSVTCEYRLNPEFIDSLSETPPMPKVAGSNVRPDSGQPAERWVRDTLAPSFATDGSLTGWEGVVEDISPQRVLAQDLSRTTTMLHTLVANLPAGVVFVQGHTGQPTLVNPRARHLLGQRENPSAGVAHFPMVYRLHKPDGTLYPWQELPVYQALKTGVATMRDDIVIHRPDGRYVPLVTWAAPVDLGGPDRSVPESQSPGNGRSQSSMMADGAVWVFEDLTSLQQAEAARIDSEIRIRTIIETMAEGLIIQNNQGAVLECNAAACAILGKPEKELVGQPSLGALGACLREDGSLFPFHEQPDAICAKTREPVRGVVIGVTQNHASQTHFGSVLDCTDSLPTEMRWLLVNCVPLTLGQPGHPGFTVRIITTFVDITEQREILRNLTVSEERYRILVETLPLVVLQLDDQFRVHYGNPRAWEILGPRESTTYQVSNNQENSRRFLDHLNGDDRSRVETWLRGIFEEKKFQGDCEFGIRDQVGEVRSCYAVAYPAPHDVDRSRPGEIARFCTLVMVDKTLERHLEQEIRRVQKLEVVGRLVGGIVHDFNNLLTPIVALSQMAQQRQPEDPNIQEDLQTIEAAGKQATQLAAQLLAFIRNRKTNAPPVANSVSVQEIVTRTLGLLRGTLPHDITVKLVLSSKDDRVLADSGQLQQILVNLCLNARDAMPRGGQLTVRTEISDHPPDNSVEGEEPSSGVRISIQDNGEGIPLEVQGKIFDPFFSTKEQGTGLGLAVVAQLVENFRGHISVQSQPGTGTCVDIWLPRSSE